MSITHEHKEDPSTTNQVNQAGAEMPAPEKPTKKRGKVFKAGAAGLAALGIAGGAFVAGSKSGTNVEAAPQPVPVEAEQPTTTQTTEQKTGEAVTELGQTITHGQAEVPPGFVVVDPKYTGTLSDFEKEEFSSRSKLGNERVQEELDNGSSFSISKNTCISYDVTYKDTSGNTRINRMYIVNPISYNAGGGITSAFYIDSNGKAKEVATIRASHADDITLDRPLENFHLYEKGVVGRDSGFFTVENKGLLPPDKSWGGTGIIVQGSDGSSYIAGAIATAQNGDSSYSQTVHDNLVCERLLYDAQNVN